MTPMTIDEIVPVCEMKLGLWSQGGTPAALVARPTDQVPAQRSWVGWINCSIVSFAVCMMIAYAAGAAGAGDAAGLSEDLCCFMAFSNAFCVTPPLV